METLFKDTEGVNKERPTQITKQQKKKLCLKLAKEIIEKDYSTNNEEDIAEDLSNIDTLGSGFEIAKKLDDCGIATYKFSGDFIDFLDGINCEERIVLSENIKLWVRSWNPQPKFKKGQKIEIINTLNVKLLKGEIVYVNEIRSEEATYLIDKNPNRKGGILITYEKAESNCKVV